MSSLPRLTGKQQVWVNAYLTCLNATEAARRAQYKGSDNVLGVVGHDNLRNPKIRAHLDYHFRQQAMSREEVLVRLTEQGRSDLVDLTNEQGVPDWEKARQAGKTHLVKKIKRKEVTIHRGKSSVTTITTEIELHDPQRALDMLGKYHELFINKIKVEDWHSEVVAGIRDGTFTFDGLLKANFERELAVELFKEAGVPVEIREGAPIQPGN